LKQHGPAVFVFKGREQARPLDARGRSGRSNLEHGEISVAERPRPQGTDVKDADQAALDDQGHPEQRANALFAENRIEDVGMVDVGDEDRYALGRDSSRESLTDGDPDSALDLLLDALGGAGHQLLCLIVD
jgi:hypothetical protein